jgi:hypothetical protein
MTDPIDIAALRARLREYDPAVPRCHAPFIRERTYEDGIAEGERRATAAVVAHLRECSRDPEATFAEAALLNQQADSIERGEHRREEDR